MMPSLLSFRSICFFALFLMAFTAHANLSANLNGGPPPSEDDQALQRFLDHYNFKKIPRYHCNLMVVNADSTVEEKAFDITGPQASHGGDERDFSLGGQDISVQVDSQFINILWRAKDKTVANVMSAVDQHSNASRVLMVKNPENPDQQIQVSCNRYEPDL
jgi:hypothetical protein